MQYRFWRNIICLVKEEFIFRYLLSLLNDNEVLHLFLSFFEANIEWDSKEIKLLCESN